MIMKNLIKHLFALAVLMAGLAPGLVWGGLVGEPAPELNVAEWVKGGPVEIKPGTNIYVVEIFESKLPASRASITNLNDCQRRFKDKGVVIMGISDEPAGVISEFMKNGGTNIEYIVGRDNGRHTALAFMKPIMQKGIPYAFIIGTNGDLLWHGLPQHGLDAMLDKITNGKYDEAVAKKMDLTQHQMEQYLALARAGSDRLQMAGRTLLATRTNDVALLCEMAYVISTAPKLMTRDFGLADEALKQAEQLAPTNSAAVGMGRAIWLFESGKRDAGLARAKEVVAANESPMEKTNLVLILNRMQTRMAAIQARQNKANADAPTASHDSGAVTNQNGAGAAGKP